MTRIKPDFSPGGKFAKLHSTFDAFETFLYVPNKVTQRGSHIRDAVDMKRTMIVVVTALMPALIFGMYNVGYQHAKMLGEAITFWPAFWYGFLQVLPIIVVSYVVGLGIEFGVAQARGHEVNEGFLVSGMLIPLIVPVDTPLWMVGLATAFSVIFAKEIFGGTGMNIFNPALVARAFLFFAFPRYMSGDSVWVSHYTHSAAVEAFSGATPLGQAAAGHVSQLPSVHDMFFGFIPGSVGETSTLMVLIGAAILLITGVGCWRIMLAVFAGGYGMGLVFNLIGANPYMEMPAYYHLMMGGFAFGAVFMATDPVTGAQTKRGQWFYGAFIGILTVVVRVFNPAYPEGMMLSILLMNAFAPLIDYLVIARNRKWRRKRAEAVQAASLKVDAVKE